MKVAVIGSRTLTNDILEAFIPPEALKIVFGGKKGIDACARLFAEDNEYKFTEFYRIAKHMARRPHCAAATRSLRIAIWFVDNDVCPPY